MEGNRRNWIENQLHAGRLSEADETKEAIIEKFKENTPILVHQLAVDDMIDVITKCNSMTTPLDPTARRKKPPRRPLLLGLAADDILDALHGIFPGTK